jgi:hypothetical protein
MLGHVSTDTRLRGLYYLFYTYDSISGGAVLAALVAGDAAVEFETKPEAQAVGEVMQLLRGIFEPQGVAVPEPLQVGRAGSGLGNSMSHFHPVGWQACCSMHICCNSSTYGHQHASGYVIMLI